MPQYFSPGVYVEEVPSAVQPIAGVSTSTAAFLGIVPDTIQIPEENPDYDPTILLKDKTSKDPNAVPYRTWTFPFPANDPGFVAAQTKLDKLTGDVKAALTAAAAANPRTSIDATLMPALRAAQKDRGRYAAYLAAGSAMADENVPVLCTTFSDFKRSFGGFSMSGVGIDPKAPLNDFTDGTDKTKTELQNWLAHAVFGFFNNGGTRCWVMRASDLISMRDPEFLTPLEAIDEISLVLAPGIVDKAVQDNIVSHCESLTSRFAILDAPVGTSLDAASIMVNVTDSDYAALYFPWISIEDPATQLANPDGDGEMLCPPSGHVAGIYSRVDHERGVFKAPANEVVRGALELAVHVSRSQQDGLNPLGVNCIRYINNGFKVWGARTVGGDDNNDLKYINVRRTLIFLRESIDRGTQWAVFEPNDRSLWAKITRNITAFLTTVWQDGALFGSSPAEAFYVKCDDETNPPEDRDLGKVTTEIGVAIVEPAEFVIFRISQWEPPTTS